MGRARSHANAAVRTDPFAAVIGATRGAAPATAEPPNVRGMTLPKTLAALAKAEANRDHATVKLLLDRAEHQLCVETRKLARPTQFAISAFGWRSPAAEHTVTDESRTVHLWPDGHLYTSDLDRELLPAADGKLGKTLCGESVWATRTASPPRERAGWTRSPHSWQNEFAGPQCATCAAHPNTAELVAPRAGNNAPAHQKLLPQLDAAQHEQLETAVREAIRASLLRHAADDSSAIAAAARAAGRDAWSHAVVDIACEQLAALKSRPLRDLCPDALLQVIERADGPERVDIGSLELTAEQWKAAIATTFGTLPAALRSSGPRAESALGNNALNHIRAQLRNRA